ncbi:MAG: hypothetical protein HPY52_15295 [Firmicutes bacterium]|nr:hypothetical protein [Bacillota bacterium]
MKTLRIAICLAVCITVATALPALASTPEQELAGILERAINVMDAMIKGGYTIEHIEFDSVKLGEVYSVPYNLYAGNLYKIIGIGGNGIADLDIHILDSDNNLLAADTLNDDVPEVDVSPKADGAFRIDTSFESLEPAHSPSEYYYFCYIVGFRQ